MCQMSERCQLEDRIRELKNYQQQEIDLIIQNKNKQIEQAKKNQLFLELLKKAKESIKW